MKSFVLFCMSLNVCLFGHINLRTTIESGDYRGTDELIGAIGFNITGDDIEDDLPVYIRIFLGKGAVLSQSLVAPGESPIHLAVAISGPTDGHQINLEPDAVSLVRANAGEGELWIKLNFQTAKAITLNGEFVLPSPERSLRFSFGDTIAQNSGLNGPLFDEGKANLPCNQLSDENVDTTIHVDLSKSILSAFPHPGSELEFDPVVFDNSTSGVETSPDASGISNGNQLGVAFSGDNLVFRGEFSDAPTAYGLVPHVSQSDSRFGTFIEIHNEELLEFTAVFLARDAFGNELESAEAKVSQMVERFQVKDLFPNTEIAQIEVQHSLFSTMSYGYESQDSIISSSPFQAEEMKTKHFKLSLIQSPSVFDGVVLTLDQSTEVTFTFYDKNGDSESTSLHIDQNKQVISLNELNGYAGAHGLKVELSEPGRLMHLRRLILEGGFEYLFPVQPIQKPF